MFCGADKAGADGRIFRMDGDCGFCLAREFNERHRAVLDAHDPFDRTNWEYYPAHDGNPKRLVYIPTKGLK